MTKNEIYKFLERYNDKIEIKFKINDNHYNFKLNHEFRNMKEYTVIELILDNYDLQNKGE